MIQQAMGGIRRDTADGGCDTAGAEHGGRRQIRQGYRLRQTAEGDGDTAGEGRNTAYGGWVGDMARGAEYGGRRQMGVDR